MKVKSLFILSGLLLLWLQMTYAQDPGPTPSDYADLLSTEIRGLSPEKIEEYRTGKGMGLALPAELNGYPGPRHVLDLAGELALSEEQEQQIQALYDQMLPEAIRIGEEILAGEAALELAYREKTIDEESLYDQLVALGQLQAELRYAHLSTHLATIEILTPHQIMQSRPPA